MSATIVIGLISDTHGLLRPQALEALQGAEMIIHAGDIGPGDIIERLSAIAPTEAIRGNIDKSDWAGSYPDTRLLEVAGKRIYVLHNIKELDLCPAERGIDVIVAGHSHKPVIGERGGALYINPGSAGPRRFKLPVCVGQIVLQEDNVEATILDLEVS